MSHPLQDIPLHGGEHRARPRGQGQGSSGQQRLGLLSPALALRLWAPRPLVWRGCLRPGGVEPRPQKPAVELRCLRGCSGCKPSGSAPPAAAVATPGKGRLSHGPGFPEGRAAEGVCWHPHCFLTRWAFLRPWRWQGRREALLRASGLRLAVVWPLFPGKEIELQLAGNRGNALLLYLLLWCPFGNPPLPCKPRPADCSAPLAFSLLC